MGVGPDFHPSFFEVSHPFGGIDSIARFFLIPMTYFVNRLVLENGHYFDEIKILMKNLMIAVKRSKLSRPPH